MKRESVFGRSVTIVNPTGVFGIHPLYAKNYILENTTGSIIPSELPQLRFRQLGGIQMKVHCLASSDAGFRFVRPEDLQSEIDLLPGETALIFVGERVAEGEFERDLDPPYYGRIWRARVY